jgi:hypothetical protein
MGYYKEFAQLKNVSIQSTIPKGVEGEFGGWKEFKRLPKSYHNRVRAIRLLAFNYKSVVVKPATYGGHMRVWVSSLLPIEGK